MRQHNTYLHVSFVEVGNEGPCGVKEVAEEEQTSTQGKSGCHAELPDAADCTGEYAVHLRMCCYTTSNKGENMYIMLSASCAPSTPDSGRVISPLRAPLKLKSGVQELCSVDLVRLSAATASSLFVLLPARSPIPLCTAALKGQNKTLAQS